MDSNEINTGEKKQPHLESCSVKKCDTKIKSVLVWLKDKSTYRLAATDPVIKSDSRRPTVVRLPNQLGSRTHLQRDTLLY